MRDAVTDKIETDHIAAVVVTFDAPDRLIRCLQAIAMQSQPPNIVYVVNNGANFVARGVTEKVLDKFPDLVIDLIQAPFNTGPAGGHYIGMKRAQEAGFNRLWVMDDDVEAEDNCLAELAELCDITVGPLIVWPEQCSKNGVIQNLPGWYGFLINRAALELVGLPDFRLVWWIEDTEYLQRRMLRYPVTSKRAEKAKVTHADGRQEKEKPSWKIFYETRNTIWYRLYEQRLRHPRKLLRSLASLGVSVVRSSRRASAVRAFVAGGLDGLCANLNRRWPLPSQRLSEEVDDRTVERLNAFIITYGRDDQAIEHVEALLHQEPMPNRILVLDNGQSADLESRLINFGQQVEYVPMVWNLGPAGAAAYGLTMLVETSDWIYWGDDDQPPAKGAIDSLMHLAEKKGADAVSSSGWLWSFSSGSLVKAGSNGDKSSHIELDTAGGGMTLLLRSTAVRKIGLPISELFWGYEDIEYLLRLREHGLRLIAPPRDGNKDRRKRSPTLDYQMLPRGYYTIRNSLYMVAHVHHRKWAAIRLSFRAMASCSRALSQGPQYTSRTVMLTISAIVDGWLGRLGAPMPLRIEEK